MGPEPARVLVTNDDGVTSAGIAALALAVADLGHDVIVAAPTSDQSGVGAAIAPTNAGEGIRVVPVEVPGLEHLAVRGIDGPPSLAVMAARLGGLGRVPEVVASGINNGPNTGFAVLHSGTVGAALTAANFGGSGLAVSIASGAPRHLGTAAAVAGAALAWLIDAPVGTVLNVNTPDLAIDELAGVRWAPLARSGRVQAAVKEHPGGRLQIDVRPGDGDDDPNTDGALLAAGFVTVTSIVGVRATEEVDAPKVIEDALGCR